MPDDRVAPEHIRNKNAAEILRANQDLYDQVYYRLYEMAGGSTVGKTPTAMKVLVHYFPPEMAELVVLLGKEAKPAEQVAEESGKPLAHVKDTLHRYWKSGVSMATKAFVDEKGYVLPPSFARMISAFPFCDGLGGTYRHWDEDEEKEVGLLTSKMHFEEGHLYQLGASKQPGTMVLVDERQVDDPAIMEDWEKGTKCIQQARQVGITRCGCRVRHGIYNNCRWTVEKPMIDTCLQFDHFMETYVDRGAGSWTTKQDALDVLWYGLDHSLVSTTPINDLLDGRPGCICQCCPDCCHVLYPWTRLAMTGSGCHRSNFDPRTDLKKCTAGDCGPSAACIKACPVPNIRFYHPPTRRDKSDEFIGLDTRRCMGCGLCAGACPEKAIKMAKVRSWVPTKLDAASRAKAGRHEWVNSPPAL